MCGKAGRKKEKKKKKLFYNNHYITLSWAPVERNGSARPHTPDCAPQLSHCKELVTAYLELSACLSNRMLFIHLSYIWDQTGSSVYIRAMSLYQTGFKKFMMHSLHSMGSAEFWEVRNPKNYTENQ